MTTEELFQTLQELDASIINMRSHTRYLTALIRPQDNRRTKINQLVFDADLTEGINVTNAFLHPNTLGIHLLIPLDKYPDIVAMFNAYQQLSPQ